MTKIQHVGNMIQHVDDRILQGADLKGHGNDMMGLEINRTIYPGMHLVYRVLVSYRS